jgi:hypothetical protein
VFDGMKLRRGGIAMDEADPPSGALVGQRLLESSTFFARSAATAYSAESWDLFYLHLATAVEQLVKSTLAASHPSFIADTRASFDSLLHLCGFGDKAKTPDFVAAVRTITVSQALDRIGRLVDGYRPPSPRVLLLLEMRNGIVHTGHREMGGGEAVLVGDVARYVEQLLSTLGLSQADYWGDSAEMVAAHMRRRLSAIEASYQRRLQAAKERFAGLADRMDPAALAAYVAAVTPTALGDHFDSALAPCPACGNEGEITGDPEPEWEPDWDFSDGQAWVSGMYVSKIQLQAHGFECRICGLTLGADELAFGGLGDVTLTDDDCDLSEAATFFERQAAEDDWEDY